MVAMAGSCIKLFMNYYKNYASEEEKTRAREAREAVRKAHRADVETFAQGNELLHQLVDLALLGVGMLKGKALADFIARSRKVVSDAYLK